MAYLGTPPQSGFITTAKQRVTSSTNNYVDLDHSISSIADVIVFVNFVKQDTTNLTLTTSTRIGLGGTLVSSDIVEIHYLGKAVATQTPDTGTVTNDMLAGSITAGKLSSTAVDNTNTNSTLITAQTEKSSLVDADKFLISDSAASGALKYVQKSNLPSGSWTLLEDDTVSSAVSGLIINSFSSTYKTHAVVFDKVRPASNDDTLRHGMQLSNDNFIQGYTALAVDIIDESGNQTQATNQQNATGYNKIVTGVGSGSNEGISGIIYYDSGLTNSSDALLYWGHIISFRHNDTYALSRVYGRFANADIAKIQYGFNSGNIASGSFKLYGIGG